ncbi:MAG: DNA polymerase I [Bacteroidetes bacterium]|nr:DNA polymerase I [Bacteroidota bacterium]
MPTQKLFLLDAMALIYRAHFAFSKNPRINSKGLNTSAVLGFANSLLEIINKEKPTHIAVAFDTSAPTFRHKAYKEYKAERQETPEDIVTAIPYIKRFIEAFNIPVLEKDGYEADDIIGTFAKKAAEADLQVYMMSTDKDFCQLVGDNVYLYKPAYMGNGVDILDKKKVLEKWGIRSVDQVIDILGLQGDKVDNIPGIPGVGEKTAKKLIEEFGSVENLIKNAGKLEGKLKERVVEFAEQGLLSKQLATIDTAVPLDFDVEKLLYKGPDKDALIALLDELEFRTIKKRLFGEFPSPSGDTSRSNRGEGLGVRSKSASSDQMSLFGETAARDLSRENDQKKDKIPEDQQSITNINTTTHNYHLADTPELRKKLIKSLEKQKEFCFDTETTAIDTMEAKLVGLAFSYKKGEAYYVPVPKNDKEAKNIANEFKAVLENEQIVKIGQNIKYDILVLKNYSIEVKGPLFDTMLAHYLLEPDMRHNMNALAESYLDYTPVSIDTLIGKKGKEQGNMRDIPIEKVVEYAGEDADITLKLKNIFAPLIKEKKLQKLLHEVELPLIHVLADMERAGVHIDPGALSKYSKQLAKESSVLKQDILHDAGTEFNIDSPKQLGTILFEKLKIDEKPKKTKTGQYATAEDVLSKLADKHEIVGKILDYREVQKLKSTYVDALPELISKKDNRVHTSFNQAVAATGRLSSQNPNLQNIPIRTAKGREIRKAFIPKNDKYVLLSADYSQIELRIMASFSKDESMIEAFRDGIDIHGTTASKVFRVGMDDVSDEMRRKAKMVNFGIIYGISPYGLSQRLDIPRKEAAEIIDSYFAEFPAIKRYMDDIINKARENEFVETILGRRRYLRDINSRNMTLRGYAERNAINAPIQGSAADMIKVAMINIHNWLKKEKLETKMILQVHDELVFDLPKNELNAVKEKVPDLMKNAIAIEVPIVVDVGVGENWLEAH